MPCDASYNVTMDLGQTNFELLVESVHELEGIEKESIEVNEQRKTISFQWKHGQVNINHKSGSIQVERGQEESVNLIKQNYTKTAVLKTAKQHGWILQGKLKQGQKTFTFQKR